MYPGFKPYRLILVLSALLFLSGCSVDDSRDECCSLTRIEFRYFMGGNDLFSRYIFSIHHYIFDNNGLLIDDISVKNSGMQVLYPNLPAGKYKIVSIGNLESKELADVRLYSTIISNAELQINTLMECGNYNNIDRIYYGSRDFEIFETLPSHYIVDMSNDHAILKVKVRWKNNPSLDEGPYQFILKNVAKKSWFPPYSQYLVYCSPNEDASLFESTGNRYVHSFPLLNKTNMINHRRDAMLNNMQEIECEFISMRYNWDAMPSISVYINGKNIINDIDLSRIAFEFGWAIDDNIQQDYGLLLEIDGDIIRFMPLEAGTKDWYDGGEIGYTN